MCLMVGESSKLNKRTACGCQHMTVRCLIVDRMAKSKKRHNSYTNEFRLISLHFFKLLDLLTVIIYSKLSEIL